MTPRLALVSGAFPPALDGIGDYTFRLARELAGSVTVLTARQPSYTPLAGVEVRGVFDPAVRGSVRAIPEAVAACGAEWTVVQYNPFSFGPRGVNPGLVGALARTRQPGARRLAVMFHETHVPPRGWRFLVLFAFQYPQFRGLCRIADAVFVSSERWTGQVRRAGWRGPVVHLPVGANIDPPSLPRDAVRARLGLEGTVLGAFGSAHPSRLMDWIVRAAEGIAGATLLYIGKDGAEIRRLAGPSLRWRDLGTLDAAEAGNALAACDLVLAPFSDGLSTRRGSALAALQSGVPVVSTETEWTDSCLRRREADGVFLSPVAAGSAAYAQAVREALAGAAAAGRRARDFHETFFAWPVIARTLVGHLTNV